MKLYGALSVWFLLPLPFLLMAALTKARNCYCKHGGETWSNSGAAVLKVTPEEALEKELRPGVPEFGCLQH